MPRQTDQLPADPAALARRVQDLEIQMRELRAARRMTSATVGRLRLYSKDGQTLLAELGPTPEGGGLWTRGVQGADDIPISAYLSSGELAFRPVDDEVSAHPAYVSYSLIPDMASDLQLDSGAVRPSDWRAGLTLSSTAGEAPYVLIGGFREVGDTGESGNCNVQIEGILTSTNVAYGTASITPSAANTPTSLTISGLGLPGSSFYAQVTPITQVPGTQVTGAGVNNISGNGITLWVTRTNTTATILGWMVVGV
ncbi:hypothetical protein ABZV65_13985 [Streptomyces bauhiniae]|uniref:hypothetical protein n=1 Tax=Streptomyces bauhiniae TaxID=2340725 RepID=UPI00339E63A7